MDVTDIDRAQARVLLLKPSDVARGFHTECLSGGR